MTVCKFWAQGSCRYGNSCRFEHPRNVGQSSNRFSALGNQGGNQAMDYGITAEQIQKDLTTEVPQWILSCYGPGKDAPEQLFGGFPREQSFEEIRLFFMEGLAKGNPQGALQDINAIYEQAQTQMRTVLNDIPGAVKFIQDAAQKHPNRIDICNQGTAQQQSTTSPFGRPTQTTDPFGKPAATSSPFGGASTTTSAFGQPAALGQKPNPFGAPAFGQPAQPSTSAFGQPSALGSTSAFGKPAVTTSAFGQPSQPTSAFGQPSQPTSAFGQPSQPTGAFGQPSALGAKPNPFGAPAFGQPAQPTSTFGQTSQPTSAFGQPAALGVKPNPFGAPAASASPFGAAASTTQSTTSAFGQPSQPAATNPFGQPATTTTASPFGQAAAAKPPAANPFGQPAAPAANPFGQPTTTAAPATKPFGQPAAPAATTTPSPFGQPTATTTPAARPFGQQAAPSASTTGGSVFGQPTQPAAAKPNPFGQPAPSTTAFSQPAAQPQAAAPPPTQDHNPYGPNASREHPHPRSYIVKTPNGSVSQFNGKPVVYATFKDKQVPVIRSFDGSTTTRVWFPDGPPGYTNETEAADPKVYEDPKVRQQWGKFVETGSFEGGVMPEVPPKREFCNWVF